MQLGIKSVAAIVAGVGAVVIAGVYTLSMKQQVDTPTTTPPQVHRPGASANVHNPVAGPINPGAALPPNHPTANQENPLSGKVGADPNARFTHFRVGNSNVKSIFVDDKIVWIGTSGGVIRYDTNTDEYRLFNSRNGLLSNGVFYVGKMDGRITVGTYGGGMSLYDQANDSWETFNLPEGLADAFVYDVLKAANGDIWIATWSGANRIRGGDLRDRSKWDTFTVENTKGGLPNDWVYGLDQGKNGEIWLATEGGLARFHDGKWQNWNHEKGLGAPFEKVKNDIQFGNDPAKVSSHHARQKEEMGLKGISVAYNPNYIISLQVDRSGAVWCGTWGGGLARFDGQKWRYYTVADGLPGNHVFMLHYDHDGQLWVGTNNGLARFDNGKFKVITTDDGLYSNTVFSMASDKDNVRWIGSFGGVARLTALK